MRKTAAILIASITVLFVPAFAQADGGELYARRCASCHGKEGDGDTAIGKRKGLKALGSAEVQAKTDSELAAKIAEGGENGDRQHAYKDKGLSDADVNDLVTFIRSLARRR